MTAQHSRSSTLGFVTPLTFLCAQSKAVIDLLEHGLATLLKSWQYHVLEGFPVGSLHWSL